MHVVVVATVERLPAPDVDEVEHFPSPVPELLREGVETFGVVFDDISQKLFIPCKLAGRLIPSEPEHYDDHEGGNGGWNEEAHAAAKDR